MTFINTAEFTFIAGWNCLQNCADAKALWNSVSQPRNDDSLYMKGIRYPFHISFTPSGPG